MTQSVWMKGDVLSGAALAALGAYIISEARHWEYSGAEGPGPGFFPMWYGIAMVVLSLLLVAGTLLRQSRESGSAVDWQGVGRALTVWAAFAASIALLKVLGFLIVLALLTLFVVAVMYGKPWKVAMAAAAGNALGFYLVFPFALGLSLPLGPLGF